MKCNLMSYTSKMAGCLSIIFFTFGCMTETSEPSIQSDQLTEASLDNDFYTYPLENLRMDPGTLSMVANLRAATAAYHDVEKAFEAGYAPTEDCVSSESGGMGYHFVNFGMVDGMFDPTMPEALLYEMDKNGKMKLVGVEFVVVADAWDATNEMPPYLGMREFDEAFPPQPLPFRNYQLHVWTWKHNPSGIFEKYNPNVKCE